MIIKYCRITMQKQTIIMQDNYVKFFTRINNVYIHIQHTFCPGTLLNIGVLDLPELEKRTKIIIF